MDSVEVVTEERTPLLNSEVEEILPSQSDAPEKPDAIGRLVSLDVFRGLTVALMILVDDAGGAFPVINHSPWFDVTLADFVMPFFLFGVGVSVALVCKKIPNKVVSTKKVIVRTVKLFLLGLILQGGYFHGRDSLTYGVDIDRIRWLGVLQRISIGYFLAAMSEIWLVSNVSVDSPVSFVKKYCIEWVVAILLSSLYIGLVYGLYVPNWAFELPTANSTLSVPDYGVRAETVQCGVIGSLEPPCNAVGLIDRLLLGERHLYQHPVYRRTKDCSINSPEYGPLPPNSPIWCLAPFDPEGVLSSLMASITCFAGLHFGHFIVHYKNHAQRMLLWSVNSLIFLLCGYIVQLLGMPFSKPLYTLSYMFLTTGASGFLLTLIYYIVDTKNLRKPFALLQWMGMNALIVYALAACELFPAAVQGFYWRSPSNNLGIQICGAGQSLSESLLGQCLHFFWIFFSHHERLVQLYHFLAIRKKILVHILQVTKDIKFEHSCCYGCLGSSQWQQSRDIHLRLMDHRRSRSKWRQSWQRGCVSPTLRRGGTAGIVWAEQTSNERSENLCQRCQDSQQVKQGFSC